MDLPMTSSLALGALGIKKVLHHPDVQVVMNHALSLVLPPSVVNFMFDKLKERDILKEIGKVQEKLDLLLQEAQESSTHLLKDAIIAYNNDNYPAAASLFQEVRQTAFKAFNHSNKPETWVICTKLKIIGTYMHKSFLDNPGKISVFEELPRERQKEIADTVQAYVDDLLRRTDQVSKDILGKNKGIKMFMSGSKIKKANQRIKEIQDSIDQILRWSYPLISQGLGWTKPLQAITPGAESLTFETFPKYIPEGQEDCVTITVASRPEILVKLHRELPFSDKKLVDLDVQLLKWAFSEVNGWSECQSQMVNSADFDVGEPVCLTIRKVHLESMFRRGPSIVTNLQRSASLLSQRRKTFHGVNGTLAIDSETGLLQMNHQASILDVVKEATIINPHQVHQELEEPGSNCTDQELQVEEDQRYPEVGNSATTTPPGYPPSEPSTPEPSKQPLHQQQSSSFVVNEVMPKEALIHIEDDVHDDDDDICAKCDKSIGKDKIKAFRKAYHQDCFRCTQCDKQLVKVFHRHEKKPYCTSCFKGLQHWPTCSHCGAGVVKGEKRVRANGNLYHSRCFTCFACHRLLNSETGFFELDSGAITCEEELDKRRLPPEDTNMKCDDCRNELTGTYFQYEGKNLCEKDYEKYRKKCTKCKKPISGCYYTDKDGKIICADDYKALHGGNLDCLKCGQEIEGGEIVRAVGGLFHPDCFTCTVCAKNLSAKDTAFMADDDKNLFCRDDYHKKHSPKCASCQEPIAPKAGEKSVPRLKALDKDWHPSCFKCQDCQEKLGGSGGKKCYPLNEVPLCLDCHKQRLAK